MLTEAVLDALPRAIAVVDSGGGVLAWNLQAQSLYGPTRAEMLQRPLVDEIVAPVDRARFEAALRGALGGQRWSGDLAIRTRQGTERRALMSVWPLRSGPAEPAGGVIGAVVASEDVTEVRRQELQTADLSSRLVVAEERVGEAERLAAAEQLLRQRMEFLGALNDAALQATDHRDLMRRVAAAAVPRLGDWCAVHFLRHADSLPETEVAHVDPFRQQWARTLLEQFPYRRDAANGVAAVIRTGQTEFIPELSSDLVRAVLEANPALDADWVATALDALSVTSVITVPLITTVGVVGAIRFVSAESRRRYDSDDVTLAQAVAGRVAAALHNASLGDHQREVSTKLQAALLPAQLPHIEGLDVEVVYRAGARMDVGGDFYDLFAIGTAEPSEGAPGVGRRTWGLAIGDVCGTGPSAAAVTAKARHTIRAAATHGVGPVEVLEWLNDAILADDRGLFCTVCFGTLERLDAGAWQFTSVAGGHPLPVHHRAAGWVSPVGRPGTLLGVLKRLDVHRSQTVLRAGDTLILYTDGITDVRPPFDIEPEDFQRMVSVAAAGASDARTIAAGLLEAIDAVLPMERRTDDIAMVVIHVTSGAARDA